MLSLLHIENIAVIERADIQFDPGFNALTGETGAGKSIVIDAISAVLGERTSRELIRTGAKSALVNAVFTGVSGLGWLEENGVPAGEELLLQREIQGDGRNICRVDGRLVTVAQLRELGRQLLNIHGQHDGQQLLDPACHLGYLDRSGHTEGELASYRTSLEIAAKDRDGLTLDVAMTLSAAKVKTTSLSARSMPDGYATVSIVLEVKNQEELTNVINKLGQIQGVYQVKRASG